MKLLFMLSRVPYPLIKGDKLRAYHHLRELSEHHEIILCALCDEKPHPDAYKELKRFCKEVHFFKLSRWQICKGVFNAFINGNPLQVGYFYNEKVKRGIDRVVADSRPDHIFCQLIRVSEYVKHFDIPKTLDYQDVFSKGVGRRVHSASFYMKPLFNMEYKRLLKYEQDVFSYFDNKIIISKPDRDLIPHMENHRIHVIPNGVDLNYFEPVYQEKIYDLVFTGNMGYPPNVNAVKYFYSKVLPLLRQNKPEIKVLIAGAHPVKAIRSMQSEHITVTGWVDDLRSCYAQSRIFIAPMQIGTGLQNKLLEAMAMQLPCVTSDLANRALEAENGKEILIGNTPENYVQHILHLLNNVDYAATIAMGGYHYISKNYNWKTITDRISEMMVGK